MVSNVHYSSNRSDWETPQGFFNRLDAEFGFTLDPCAWPHNAKCARYYTSRDDGLQQAWSGVAFVNPPYGRGKNGTGAWVRKSYLESIAGTLVVMLIPSRTDTAYWHECVMQADEVRFVRGRLHFVGAPGPAPFPSAVVVFRLGHKGPPLVRSILAKLPATRRAQ